MSNILCLYWGNPTFYPYIIEKLKYLKNKKKIFFVSRDYKDFFFKKNFLENLCKSYVIKHIENKILHIFSYLFFLTLSSYILIFKNIKIVILYDRNASIFFFIAKIFKKKIIYHNFDYNPENISFTKNFKIFIIQKIEKLCAKYSDLLIFSNNFRAKKFLSINKIKNKYLIAFNGPSHNNKYIPKKIIKQKNIIWTGTLGKGHALENIIKSFNFLDKEFNLTIICHYVFSSEEYLNNINKLIVSNNLIQRVKIFTTFTYNDFIQKLKKSIIGLAIYEPTNLSHKYMIGASNKINFYMKYSLPIVLSKNKEQVNFIKKYKNGTNVNHKDPKSIAIGIKRLLRNTNKYRKMSHNSFKTFRNEFNFYNKFKAIKNFLDV